MPANRASLALSDAYHDRAEDIARRAALLAADRVGAADPTNLGETLQAGIVAAAQIVAGGKAQAAALSRGYLRRLTALERGEPLEVAEAEDLSGYTADGRPIVKALGATAAKVYLALRRGAGVARALEYGRFSAARLAFTETLDGARFEANRQIEAAGDLIRGWRWRSRGTCAGCSANDDGAVRAGAFYTHPNCRCIAEPVVQTDRPERHVRESARQRFERASTPEQDAMLGPKRAKMIRAREVKWEDLARLERHPEFRPAVVATPVEDLARAAGRAGDEGG